MTRLALIFLTGCAAPQFANQNDPPRGHSTGPAVAAYEAKIVGALHEKENQQVKLAERRAISKAHREHSRTNDLTMPPIPQNFATHPRNEKPNRP